MTEPRRKFTPEDRLSILQEGEREGQASTIRKYHLAPSLYARWKRKYLNEGIYGLKDKHKKSDPRKTQKMALCFSGLSLSLSLCFCTPNGQKL